MAERGIPVEDNTWSWERIARFLYEGAMLKRTYRTGYSFLGKGKETVAAHTFGVLLIGFVLASRIRGVDLDRVIRLCMVHDLPEARTGDANAVHKRYVTIDEDLAVEDMVRDLPVGGEIRELLREFEEGESLEARVARDADQLDMLLSLKEQMDTGSDDARIWIPHVKARLKTPEAMVLAEAMLSEHWAAWWMSELIGDQGPDGE